MLRLIPTRSLLKSLRPATSTLRALPIKQFHHLSDSNILPNNVDTSSPQFLENQERMNYLVKDLESLCDKVSLGNSY
jgi:hypothetical protein